MLQYDRLDGHTMDFFTELFPPEAGKCANSKIVFGYSMMIRTIILRVIYRGTIRANGSMLFWHDSPLYYT